MILRSREFKELALSHLVSKGGNTIQLGKSNLRVKLLTIMLCLLLDTALSHRPTADH